MLTYDEQKKMERLMAMMKMSVTLLQQLKMTTS